MQRQVRRRIGRNEKTKAKSAAQKPIEKKWIFLTIGVLVAIVAVVTSIAAFRNVDWTVARIDGRPIRISYLGHALWEAQQQSTVEYFEIYPDDDEIDFDRPFRGIAFGDFIRQQATINVAVSFLLEVEAERLGVSLTDEDIRLIQVTHVDEWGNDFSPLYAMGITNRQQLTDFFVNEEIRNNVVYAILSRPEEMQRFDLGPALDELLAAQHILVGVSPDATDEEALEAFELAESLIERLNAGEDFEDLMLMYSEDPGQPLEGYTFTAGAMAPEFEQGTRELEIGGVSVPIGTTFGYHIIRRIEPIPSRVMGDNPLEDVIIEDFRNMARARIELLPALSRVGLE